MLIQICKYYNRRNFIMMTLIGGLSGKDRISYATSNRAITAIRKKNKRIELVESSKLNISNRFSVVLSIIYIILCITKVYGFIPWIENGVIEKWCYFIPTVYLFISMIISVLQFRYTEGKEALKNHGAEHKVFMAYKRLKRIPKIEEAKKFSRISRYCGIAKTSAFIVSQIIGFILYTYMGYRISEILLYLVPALLCNVFPFYLLGNFAQLFTTANPEEKNLELAITALTELKQREEKAEIGDMIHNIILRK